MNKKLFIYFLPMIILQSLGFIVGIGWLVYESEWRLLAKGIIAFVSSVYLIGIATIPGIILGIPAINLLNKGYKTLGMIAVLPSVIYHALVFTAWISGVFYYFTYKYLPNEGLIIPLSLFSYGIATAPSAIVLASEQVENPHNTINSVFSSIAALSAVICIIFFKFAILFTLAKIICAVMLIGGLISFIIESILVDTSY